MPLRGPKVNVEQRHYIKFRLNGQDMFYVGGLGDEEKDWSPNFADAKLFKDFSKATEVCRKVSPNAGTVALKMATPKKSRK